MPAECHGRARFPGRPLAGTSPWEWWWSTFATAGVLIYVADTGSRWGETRWAAEGAFIVLHYKLTTRQRTEAIAHEMHHLAIGGVCTSLCPRNESKVRKATARWLLPDVESLAGHLRRGSVGSVAHKLGITSGLIWERLEWATPTERKIIEGVLGPGPDWLPEARAAQPTLATAG